MILAMTVDLCVRTSVVVNITAIKHSRTTWRMIIFEVKKVSLKKFGQFGRPLEILLVRYDGTVVQDVWD